MDPLFVFVTVCCFLSSVSTLGVKFQCPEYFQDGVNIVTCKINTTAIEEAQCSSKYTSVTFRRTIYSQTTVACQSPSYGATAGCTQVETPTPRTCSCHEVSGEIITYKFAFVGNSSIDEGGQLQCDLCVLPENPLDVNVSESCKNMRFVTHNAPEAATDWEEISSASPGTETNTTAVWIPIVITAVIVIIIVIVGMVLRRRYRMCDSQTKRKKRNGDSKVVRNGVIMETVDRECCISPVEENDEKKQSNGTLLHELHDTHNV